MSAHVDSFFVPVKKRPRAAEQDASAAEQKPQQKRKAKAQKAQADGGFRAVLEAKPVAHEAEEEEVPADENADEKRIRMAKKYLEAVRDELGGEEADPDEIATRLFSEVCATTPTLSPLTQQPTAHSRQRKNKRKRRGDDFLR